VFQFLRLYVTIIFVIVVYTAYRTKQFRVKYHQRRKRISGLNFVGR